MRTRVIILAACLLATAARADDQAPWQTATAIAKATDTDLAKSGYAGIAPHVADLEKALTDGDADFPPKPSADGEAVVLVDGPTETLAALAAAAEKKQPTIAMQSPYGEIGLLLALYYNENRKPDEALRVIDIAFKLKPVSGLFVGTRDAALLTERATAYNALKRWDDGLAAADAALKASRDDRDKARSDRSRGFFLTELARLEEAEAAYRDSLKLEPGNALATRELAYIARLRTGGSATQPEIISPGVKPPTTPAQ